MEKEENEKKAKREKILKKESSFIESLAFLYFFYF